MLSHKVGSRLNRSNSAVAYANGYTGKARRYLAPGEQPPAGKHVITGSQGGRYYQSGREEGRSHGIEATNHKDREDEGSVHQAATTVAEHRVPKVHAHHRPTFVEGYKHGFTETYDPWDADEDKALTKGRFDESLGLAIQLSGFVANARRYVSNPGSAPEGVSVKEGEHGGHYYETGPETAGPKNERPSVTRERERRALDDSRSNRARGEEQHRRTNMPELDEALGDLNELMVNVRDGGGLRNPQELVDAARNVARAMERQNGIAGQDPKRSELASQADADRSALQHALELHQNWKNRFDYAEAKHVPGEEMSAVQERLQSAKNEVLQARDKYKQSRQALDQYSSGKRQKPGAADAETEKWRQMEQRQAEKVQQMAASGAKMGDVYKQGEVLTQIRNRLRSMERQRQRAAKPAAKPGRKMNNHEDSNGSTAHHRDMYRDEYEDHAEQERRKAPKAKPTPEQTAHLQERDQYRRQMDFAELDLHEDSHGSTEHHHGAAPQTDREAAHEAIQTKEKHWQQSHPSRPGGRERPTDPRERSMQADQDALEDAEGMSSDEIVQLARRSNLLALPWRGMNDRQAKTYMRRYHQGLLQAHDKAKQRESAGKVDNHEDSNGSTEHHHGVKGLLGMKTPRQKDQAAAREAGRGMDARAEIERRTGRRLNMHEDANGSTEHHHKGGAGAAKPQYGTERGRLKARSKQVQAVATDAYRTAYREALSDGLNGGLAHQMAWEAGHAAGEKVRSEFDSKHAQMEWPHEQARREKKEQLFNGDRLNMHEDSHGSTEHHRKGMSAADAHAATEQAHAAWMDAKRTGSPEAPKLQAQWREAGQTLRDLREHEQAEQAEQTAATTKPKRQSAPRAPQFRSELAQRGQHTAQSLLQPGMSQDDIREKYDSLRRATPAAMARTTGDMSYGNMRSKEWHEFQGAALRSLAQAWKQAGSTEDKAGLSIG